MWGFVPGSESRQLKEIRERLEAGDFKGKDKGRALALERAYETAVQYGMKAEAEACADRMREVADKSDTKKKGYIKAGDFIVEKKRTRVKGGRKVRTVKISHRSE